MSNDERFIELWNDYLEGELDESAIAEFRAIVSEDDRLLSLAADSYQIHRLLGLIAQDSESQREAFVDETMTRIPADDERFVDDVMQHLPRRDGAGVREWIVRLLKWPGAIAAAAAITLLASLVFLHPDAEPAIAQITGLSGPLQWTGDGGQVFQDLRVGTDLSGGTIEGMAASSWFELQFNDGSKVTVSSDSMLTFSDRGQKKLHLKEGVISGDVRPQPTGRPMLIYTRSALLEVVGTQFEVEAGLSATLLNVGEGKVLVRRLSDGNTVEVPAKHRVVAAADREMSPVAVPDSVYRWISQLHLGPDGTYGKWSPRTETESARIRAIPYTTHTNHTIYAASVGVSRGDSPTVILEPTSRFRVRGRVESACMMFFGVTLRRPNGEFAGNFQTIRPDTAFQSGQEFEVVVELRDFHLDPTLAEIKHKLPEGPFGLAVEHFWCHTLGEQAGLDVTEVELIGPVDDQGQPEAGRQE